jgi:hypothetical protein
VWASFDWVVGIDPEEAVERQREVTRLSAERPLVVQTGVLEEETYNWLPPGRKAQWVHTSTVWLSEDGLATTRVASVADG